MASPDLSFYLHHPFQRSCRMLVIDASVKRSGVTSLPEPRPRFLTTTCLCQQKTRGTKKTAPFFSPKEGGVRSSFKEIFKKVQTLPQVVKGPWWMTNWWPPTAGLKDLRDQLCSSLPSPKGLLLGSEQSEPCFHFYGGLAQANLIMLSSVRFNTADGCIYSLSGFCGQATMQSKLFRDTMLGFTVLSRMTTMRHQVGFKIVIHSHSSPEKKTHTFSMEDLQVLRFTTFFPQKKWQGKATHLSSSPS